VEQLAACSKLGVRLSLTDDVTPNFRAALDSACAGLTPEEVDPDTVLEVTMQGSDVRLSARLTDGRSATRRITLPSQLTVALRALVLKPPALSHPAFKNPLEAEALPEFDPLPRPIQQRQRPLSFEAGAGVSARVAGAPTTYLSGLSGYAGVNVDRWLLALNLRWDPLDVLARPEVDGLEMDAAGAGVSLLRRFGPAGARVDVGASATFLLETQSIEPGNGEHGGSQTDFRLGVLARGVFNRTNPRVTLSLELNASPARLRRELRIDPALPPLPKWELGAGIGTSWSQL
jgi:hypothetical protein